MIYETVAAHTFNIILQFYALLHIDGLNAQGIFYQLTLGGEKIL